MKEVLSNLLTGILVACAVAVTLLLVRQEIAKRPDAHAQVRIVPEWQEYAKGRQLGSGDGRVAITVFSDFQCSFCGQLASRLDSLVERMPDRLSIFFRHFPMGNLHPKAGGAAIAAECAAAQGRFKQYHNALFAKQDSISVLPWTRYAIDAGVPDTFVFNSCLADSSTLVGIRNDVDAGFALGVKGTPALLVNNQFHYGAPSTARLEALIRNAESADQSPPADRMLRASTGEATTGINAACVQRPSFSTEVVDERGGQAADSTAAQATAPGIRRREVCVGMTRDLVRAAWGLPSTIRQRSREGIQHAEWRYGQTTLFISGDTVHSIR